MSYEKHVNTLIDEAKDLVSTLKNNTNPDVQRLRNRVDAFISDWKQRKTQQRAGSLQYTRLPGSFLDYVHEHPFMALVTAASLAWTVSHLSSASRRIPHG